MPTVPEGFGVPEGGPVLILAPTGRDAETVQILLGREDIDCRVCPTLQALGSAIDSDTGAVLIADEAFIRADLSPLTEKIAAQPPWSDLPFIVLTRNGPAARRMVAELHLPQVLGNVIFLERPLNAVGLTSAIGTALRARRRQRQVRDHMAERAAITETLRQFNETLEARVAERTKALRASEAALAQSQKMEAVGRLTGGIAHDFNNLLTAVVGNLELLQLRVASDERALRLAAAAFEAAMRGAKLTTQLLAYSRTQKLALGVIDVNAVLRGTDELLARTVGPLIELRLLLDPAARPAIADANQLELAILNLALNARDAMPEGGRLTITTGRQVITPDQSGDGRDELGPGRYVVISVVDTGTGMPPEVLARAMEPFFTTKGIGQGTGLGLSQVYGIARQSGGDVRIESSAGRGTTVRILLREARRAARPNSSTAIDPSSIPQSDQGPLGSVLVIDDDEDVRRIFVAGLQAYGYRASEAADGPTALHMLEQGMTVDVAVVDFAMPRMNGAALAQAARRLQPGLPIVFASGYADTAAFEAVPGATILRKPIQIAELANAVRRMLRIDATQRPASLISGLG
jgi:signal transduction histidine kinase/ActR/RegA family two-component response regulator